MIELSSAGPDLWRQGFAGDVFNTLWYARAHLSDAYGVQFHTGLGVDDMSARMRGFFGDHGVDLATAVTVQNRVPGLYAITLNGAERSFTYWRNQSAARLMMTGDLNALTQAFDAAGLVYFSGITLAILDDAGRASLLDMAARAKAAGKTVAFDPNLRPRLWDSTTQMCDWVMKAAAVSTLALPSFDDEAVHFGDADTGACADRYHAAGVRDVVVKDGTGATILSGTAGRQALPVTPVSGVRDTTAAGDSFNGALFAHLMVKGDLAGAIRAGQACAAKVVCEPGALIDQAMFAQIG